MRSSGRSARAATTSAAARCGGGVATAILAWTEMLRRGRLREAQAAEALELIERSTRLQARLIDDLLDVSRIVAGKLTIERRPVEMASVVKDAVAALGRDAERLQQVALNLVANAIKFTPSGGHIEVAVAADAARVTLTVRDTGEGIEPGLLPHVFDRFRQGGATKDGRSLGLGLAIVRHLVELHDGTCAPRAPGPAAAPPSPSSSRRSPPALSGRREACRERDACREVGFDRCAIAGSCATWKGPACSRTSCSPRWRRSWPSGASST